MAEGTMSQVNEVRFCGMDINLEDGYDVLTPPMAKRMRHGNGGGGGNGGRSGSDTAPRAKAKVQELFFTWLCDCDAQDTINRLVVDALAGRELERPVPKHLPCGEQTKSISMPRSPVSHLIYTSATFPASPNPQSRLSRPQPQQPTGDTANLQLTLEPTLENLPTSPTFRELQHSGSQLSSLSRRTSYGSISGELKTERPKLKCFYYPKGRIHPPERDGEEIAAVRDAFRVTAKQNGMTSLSRRELTLLVVDFIGLPSFLTAHVHHQMVKKTGSTNADRDSQRVTEEQFTEFFRHFCVGRSNHARLFYILLDDAERNYLERENLRCVLDGVLQFHPGLTFLRKTPEFQSRYTETVIERIFYSCAHRNSCALFLGDIVKSGFLECLLWLDQEDDINLERRFFSYKHFYVLYCRFWELDLDHDLVISMEDLLRYGNGSLTVRIVQRVFSGCGKRNDCRIEDRLGYTDFVWFCLSEEDKRSARSLEYWFKCIDLDGDGIITLDDMEYFYREQYSRMEDRGHEPIQFVDIVCQLLDMLKFPPQKSPSIRKEDLRLCNMQSVFFNFLFNLNKFFQIESRDPRLVQQERAMPDFSDWDRFAAAEYERMTAVDDNMGVMSSDATVPGMEL